MLQELQESFANTRYFYRLIPEMFTFVFTYIISNLAVNYNYYYKYLQVETPITITITITLVATRGGSRISERGVKIIMVHPTSIENVPKSYTAFCFKHHPCIMQDFEQYLSKFKGLSNQGSPYMD